jgi:formamidopyrimidine-DNA glycosylase
MPELPEVEIARRTLVRWFEGHSLVRTEAEKARTFRRGQAKDFERLRGPLTKAERRGKYLMLSFGDEGLMPTSA